MEQVSRRLDRGNMGKIGDEGEKSDILPILKEILVTRDM